MATAVYAASLDPVTRGHLWMIQQGARLFDRVIVAIGINPGKSPTFPLEQRLDLTRRSIAEAGLNGRIEVDSFERMFLVDFARKRGADILLRGIRNESDFTYEMMMRHVNGDLAPEMLTVALMPPRELREVSSSFVRGLVGHVGWEAVVGRYVTPTVLAAMQELYADRLTPSH
ncbi:MAG TPA: pantetheine-phosphate adenylyltransferase [Azospirillum sp.]|nr:pantetheine-phosphate adenylyltransferase [Azospirillum sp.]